MSLLGVEIGDYKIQRKIGSGGMGIVYQGIHVRLEQTVAIKDLSPELASDPEMRARFIREAKIQARLNHPNVVNVHNLLEYEGRLLLVMEFVEGQTLDKIIQERGALPSAEAVRIAKQVLDALSFMHSKGVIHRDLKPGNIIITPDGRVKVTDFGIAKATTEQSHTRAGTRLGTLWYMSPEQVKGKPVDARSDLYAMGVTLFQMVTGKLPFFGDSDFEIMKAHMETPPPNPKKIKKDVPEPLSGVILKLLEKNPEKRFQTAGEVLKALELQGTRLGSLRRAAPKGEGVKAVPKEPTARKAGRIPPLVWILVGVLVLGAGLIVFIYWYVNRKQVVIPVVKAPALEKKVMPSAAPRVAKPGEATRGSNEEGRAEEDIAPILEELEKGVGKKAEKGKESESETAPENGVEKKKERGVASARAREKHVISRTKGSSSHPPKGKSSSAKGEVVEMTPSGELARKGRKARPTPHVPKIRKEAKSYPRSHVEMGPQGSLKEKTRGAKTRKLKSVSTSEHQRSQKEKKTEKNERLTIDKQIGHFFKSLKKSVKDLEHPGGRETSQNEAEEEESPSGRDDYFPSD